MINTVYLLQASILLILAMYICSVKIYSINQRVAIISGNFFTRNTND